MSLELTATDKQSESIQRLIYTVGFGIFVGFVDNHLQFLLTVYRKAGF